MLGLDLRILSREVPIHRCSTFMTLLLPSIKLLRKPLHRRNPPFQTLLRENGQFTDVQVQRVSDFDISPLLSRCFSFIRLQDDLSMKDLFC